MIKPRFIPFNQYEELSVEMMKKRSEEFYNNIKRRRTVRNFSNRSVHQEVIQNCLRAAGTAPNGANRQPWHFVAVSDPDIKKEIRIAAEEEEHEFYKHRLA